MSGCDDAQQLELVASLNVSSVFVLCYRCFPKSVCPRLLLFFFFTKDSVMPHVYKKKSSVNVKLWAFFNAQVLVKIFETQFHLLSFIPTKCISSGAGVV